MTSLTHNSIRPSLLNRLAICPASFKAASGAGERKRSKQDEEMAERGTIMHNLVQSEFSDKVECPDIVDSDIRRDAAAVGKHVEALVASTFKGELAVHAYVEKHVGAALNELFGMDPDHGHADLVFVGKYKVLLIDIKSSMTYQVPAYRHNQLKAYAAALYKEIGLPVEAYIVSPQEMSDLPLEIGNHNSGVMELGIEEIIILAMDKDAPFKLDPSACRYCPAYGTEHCPVSIELGQKVINTAVVHENTLPTAPMTDVMLTGLLKHAKQITELIKIARSQALEIKRWDPDRLPDLTLKKGGKTKRVDDVGKAFDLLHEKFNINSRDFIEGCKISKPILIDLVLQSLIENARPCEREEAESIFYEACDECLSTTISKDSVSYKKSK